MGKQNISCSAIDQWQLFVRNLTQNNHDNTLLKVDEYHLFIWFGYYQAP